MKNFILIFVTIVLASYLKAQEYIPMAVDESRWIIRYDEINTPIPVDMLWEYYANGDTIVNNTSYVKVYKRDLIPTADAPPYEPNGNYDLYGLIRDDTLSRKVYAILFDDNYFCPENAEYELFDFSVEVGDTIEFCSYPDFLPDFVIGSITDDEYLNYQTRIYSNNQLFDYDYYEGMGSYFGLFEPMIEPVKSANEKSVFHTYLYYYCRQIPCGLLVSVKDFSYQKESFTVYPIPAARFLHISFTDDQSDGEIVITNIQGQILIRNSVNKSESTMVIDVANLPTGLYIIGMIQDKRMTIRKKVFIYGSNY